MELSWFFLLLMTASTASAASYCPFGNSSSCQCEDYEGGHDLWCPDRYNHDYRFNYKGGVVWITCNPEKQISGEELIGRAAGFQLPYVTALKLEHCPVLTREDAFISQVSSELDKKCNYPGFWTNWLRYDRNHLT